MRGDQLDGSPIVEQEKKMIKGKCTAEGTQRFKERAVSKLGLPAKNYRKTYPMPSSPLSTSPLTQLDLSTVGYGTFIGKPEDEDDFDTYVAAKYLIRSGAINLIDTAINYRCQKAERTMGTVLTCLLSDEFGPY